MWVVIPIKSLHNAKRRLSPILNSKQRAHFSYLLLLDLMETLALSDSVDGISIVSSDPALAVIAREHDADFMLMKTDCGYAHDALMAIQQLSRHEIERIAIIPSDVPQLVPAEVEQLNQTPAHGVTLCPARMDGGTNALVFTPPLEIPLLFGRDSFIKHQQAARNHGLDVRILHLPGLERDIDRPQDLLWLGSQATGGKAWSYIKHEMRVAC